MKITRRSRFKSWIQETIYSWLGLIKIFFGQWFSPPYEPNVCAMIYRIVKPEWVCVDVGANVGLITHILAKQVGARGKVFAFEAFYKNAKILRRMAKIFGYGSRIQVENLAVSDGSQSEACLFSGRESSNAEWNIIGHDLEGNVKDAVYRVSATSLDNYFPPGFVLNFVKIDIEGAEALALRGMHRILRESRPVLLVEFHNEAGWAGREELLAANYALYDMKGNQIDKNKDIQRLYHCLACPIGKSIM